MEYIQAALAIYTFAKYIYRETKIGSYKTRERIELPRLGDGAPIPMFWGRCRVKSPLIAWHGNATAVNDAVNADVFNYKIDILFAIGTPFQFSDTRLQGIFIDERRGQVSPDNLSTNFAPAVFPFVQLDATMVGGRRQPTFTQLFYEFGGGSATQSLVAGAGSRIAQAMVDAGIDSGNIPGYRGYAVVYAQVHRVESRLPAISFEISSYPAPLALNYPTSVGLEANPADVIYDILTGKFGKLNLPVSMIDIPTFQACAITLYDEGHGYSRVIDDAREAGDIINEILRQIAGVMYEDPVTGTIKLKLIRPDFDFPSLPQIGPDNGVGLSNFAAGGWTSVVNKVRIVFPDRSANYTEGSATAHNQANAVGQDGEAREAVIQMPGVCTQTLANAIAARELAAMSRPISKFTAIVDRGFWWAHPGAPVAVSWPEYNISSMVCRVAAVRKGAADSNTMELDLIQDFAYVHRYVVSGGAQVAPFPGSGGLLAS